MDDVKDSPRSMGPGRDTGDRNVRAPGRRFGYEMAFDPRFAGRRWGDVEPELQGVYADWTREHGYEAAGGGGWDDVKGVVRDAWESALEVEHTQVDPGTGQWEELGPEYRRLWAERQPSGGRWEDVEPGYRYAVEMGGDPRYQGRPWGDVAPFLEAGLPGWAASRGYQVREGESLWNRLRDSIRHAWDRATHRAR